MTDAKPQTSIRFVPTRVDGLDGVDEVTAYPDRLALQCGKELGEHSWLYLVEKWPWWVPAASFGRWLYRRGWRSGGLMVGERDILAVPLPMVTFFTQPPLTIWMPDERDVPYPQTVFRMISEVLLSGGFATIDMT